MSQARITWIGGPVLRAQCSGPFYVYEAVAVGPGGLLGEVIQLKGDELVAQVYEDTTGLMPGDMVAGTGNPLAVKVGPGLLGNIFDGLLRPLHRDDGVFVRAGGAEPQASGDKYRFEPRVALGETLDPGACFGAVIDASGERPCLLPPDCAGAVTWMAAAGRYDDEVTVCRIDTPAGDKREVALSHVWPVRRARPVTERLPVARPLVTGQRILDTLFPVGRGSRAAIPGGFGTGKTILQEALAKWCDADVIVYVGCGERGNEMAEVLDEFPELEDPRTGRALMERTVIIANTSNMPVAAREASIYTAITVAEYFRDQGLNVALMADSTSRWAEALREVSGRLGELPAEAGYPAYLASRLAEFYERAARVRPLAGGEGSVTIIGAISPAAGDFSEPVTMHTTRYVSSFWALDQARAQARFYPAIHPLQSYSAEVDVLAGWWQLQGNADWLEHRNDLLTLLEEQTRLERMARIVGKDALPAAQQLTLLCADLVNDGVLRQSSFSPVDRYCSPERQTAMLRLIMRFIERARRAVSEGVQPDAIADLPILQKLRRLGEEFGEDRIRQIELLGQQLDREFHTLIGTSGEGHAA
jgi:V/A-type H+-transporting ATPase subunit A